MNVGSEEKQVRVTCQGADSVDVEDLVPFQGNLKALSDTAFDKLKQSVLKYGISFPVFVWKSGGKLLTIDGHQRDTVLRKMKAEGYDIPQVPVVYVDAGSKKEAREKILLLSSQYGKMTGESLLEFVGDSEIDLSDMASVLDLPQIDIDELLDSMEPDPPDAPEAEMGRADELQEKWQVKLGDVWEVGRHRLMCGSSAEEGDAATLTAGRHMDMVLTDPPYGVDYTGKTKAALKIENDSRSEEDLVAIVKGAFDIAENISRGGAYWYSTVPAGPLHLVFTDDWKARGILRQVLVWVKDSMVLGHSEYHYQHEPILFGWKPGERHKNKDRTRTSVWSVARPKASQEHPTMKPVELWRMAVNDGSRKEEAIYDPFLGSGTTMVAAEQLGRTCYGMEISPAYCSVILERMTEMGLAPERVQG